MKKISSNIIINGIIPLLIINNLLYQTENQIDQTLLNISILCILGLHILLKKRVATALTIPITVLALSFIVFFYLSETSHEQNRTIINSITIVNFILILIYARDFNLKKAWIAAIIIMIFGAALITITNDRFIINPNWYAMTGFYLLALSEKKRSLALYILFISLSFGIYESRGTTVSLLITVSLIALLKYTKEDTIKKTSSILFISLSFISFIFLNYYYNNTYVINELLYDGNSRGLGGRDSALLLGYETLLESNFLGYGLSHSGSLYIDDFMGRTYDAVHIHFGLLDISLKISILGVIVVFWLANQAIKKSDSEQFPSLYGALISVFYYNAFSISHYGLNYLLYILIGYSIYHTSTAKNTPPH